MIGLRQQTQSVKYKYKI